MAYIRRARIHRRRWATRWSAFRPGSSALAETRMAWMSVTPCSARSRLTATSRAAPDESLPRSTYRRCPPRCSSGMGSSWRAWRRSPKRSLPATFRRALEATPDEVADRIMVAGTPEDWVRWITETYAPAGLNHALVSFTDPFTLRAWAGIDVEHLPDLGEQVRIFGEQVLPEISSL